MKPDPKRLRLLVSSQGGGLVLCRAMEGRFEPKWLRKLLLLLLLLLLLPSRLCSTPGMRGISIRAASGVCSRYVRSIS